MKARMIRERAIFRWVKEYSLDTSLVFSVISSSTVLLIGDEISIFDIIYIVMIIKKTPIGIIRFT